ncbi:PAS-domain containing protein, partial [Sinorhizobium meliloti]
MTRNERGALPADIYLSFVSSLYQNRGTLVIGMLSHVVTFLLVFLKTSDTLYLGCTVAIVVLWIVRNLDMMRFDQLDLSGADYAAIRMWENRYIVGGVAVTLTCGIACGYAIAVTRDVFSQVACVSVTLASMISLVGRNYGSERAVLLLSSSACLPMMIGALSLGDPFMAVLAVLIVPFILTTWMMANNVRGYLFEKILAARDENVLAALETKTIAGQFDAALNNMTHGLFMLDDRHRIVVANERACELLHLGDKAQLKGWLLGDVLERGSDALALDPERSDSIARQLDLLIEGKRSRALVTISEELLLEFSANRRENGEIVLIFEDVTARVQAERQVLQMVRFDTLTGLPSRDY